MKLKIFFSLTFLLYLQFSYTQDKKENKQKRQIKIDTLQLRLNTLQNKIEGVKYADFQFSIAQVNYLINNSYAPENLIISGIRKYLEDDLGIDVILTEEQRHQAIKNSKSKCDFVSVAFEIGAFKSVLAAVGTYPFSFSFEFCDKSVYSFNDKLNVNGWTNYVKLARGVCNYNFFPLKRTYNASKRMSIKSNEIIITQESFKKYLDSNQHKNEIEGIYWLFSSDDNTSKYSIGIKQSGDTLKVIYFSGADLEEDWREGELKGYLIKTLSESDYILKWYSLDKSLLDGSISFTNKNFFELRINTIGYSNGIDKFIRIK